MNLDVLAETRRQRWGLGRPETFDFFGFIHCCSKGSQGHFKILQLTMKKRMRATLAAIRVELRRKLHKTWADGPSTWYRGISITTRYLTTSVGYKAFERKCVGHGCRVYAVAVNGIARHGCDSSA